jgi:hypothetical protein
MPLGAPGAHRARPVVMEALSADSADSADPGVQG